MSGLEIVAGIAGIVSAFVTVSRAVRSIHQNRQKKKIEIARNASHAESQLLTTLDDGPKQIKGEYARDLARIGPAFEQGDGIN